MQADDPVLHVIDALNALAIPFMMVGSYSSNLYGIPRGTEDADFVIELADRPIAGLARLLDDHFRLDPQMGFETVTGRSRWLFLHRTSIFQIELFLLPDDEFDRARFSRRREYDVLGRRVWFQSPEDLIVVKLRWRRSKDKLDVVDVIKVSGARLDWDYVEKWCRHYGMTDLLAEARQAARTKA